MTKPERCGYCSSKLENNKCVCGGEYDSFDDRFTHPEKPTLICRPNKSTVATLNKYTGEWSYETN